MSNCQRHQGGYAIEEGEAPSKHSQEEGAYGRSLTVNLLCPIPLTRNDADRLESLRSEDEPH